MTYPRSHLVDPEGGVYHVFTRCVRRAFLCGVDELTGCDYSHRRQWVEDKLFELGEIFSVTIYAYAVMSNHYHIVLGIEPCFLSDEEVAEKWLEVCPVGKNGPCPEIARAMQKSMILGDKDKIIELRSRLGSLSWFMRFLDEGIARRANQEDDCTGRFWDGRFRCQRLLDEASVLGTMVYVDLNPIRAGIANDLSESEFTSILHRLKCGDQDAFVGPINKSSAKPAFAPIKLCDYVALIRWTASAQANERRAIQAGINLCLKSNHTNSDYWFRDHMPKPNTWQRAIGPVQALKDYAKSIGQCWVKSYSMPFYG